MQEAEKTCYPRLNDRIISSVLFLFRVRKFLESTKFSEFKTFTHTGCVAQPVTDKNCRQTKWFKVLIQNFCSSPEEKVKLDDVRSLQATIRSVKIFKN